MSVTDLPDKPAANRPAKQKSAIKRLYRGETDIDFIGTRKRWYLASAVLVIVFVISFAVRGFNLGVEFKGGSTFQYKATSTVTSASLETAFTDAGHKPAEAPQTVGSGDNRSVVVNTVKLTSEQVTALTNKVRQEIGAQPIGKSVISSQWGHDTTIKALEGLLIFLVVVTIYISIRFQWRMAVGGMIALIHDLVVAAGVYSLVGFEVTPSTIVGLLTILGFSLYDTVVVYDKVAENSKDLLAGSRMTYSRAANLAVNQTLMRSINTSLIALLPVAGLLFVGAGILGVGTIEDLALILFVGLLSGAYSSLFLATPIVVDLTERQSDYKALARRVAAKQSAEARRQAENEELIAAGRTPTPAPRRGGGPAPAPRPGARPASKPATRNNRRKR